MLLLTKISRRLRRRRVEADQVWRAATRTRAAEHDAAVERILAQAAMLRGAARAVPDRPPDAGLRRVWVDTGSGPGYEVLVPKEDWTDVSRGPSTGRSGSTCPSDP